MDIEAALTSLIEAVGRVETRLSGVDARLSGIETHIKSQPDLRLLMETSRSTLDRMVHIEGEMRMLRSAINDHARENVPSGEMAAVHHDLDLM